MTDTERLERRVLMRLELLAQKVEETEREKAEERRWDSPENYLPPRVR